MENVRDRFIGNISLMLASTGIRLFIGLVTIIIIVRSIPVEHFGVYVLIQTIGMFFVIMSDFGLNYSASKFIVSADEGQRPDWTSTLTAIRIVTNIMTVIALIALKPLILAMFKSSLLDKLFPFVVMSYAFQSLEFFFNHVLQGFCRYKKIAVADILIAVSRLILVGLFISYMHMGLLGACWSFVLSLIIGLVMLLPAAVFKGRPRKRYAVETAGFAWPIEINSILSFFDYKVYGLIIAYFLGPVSLALFEAANRIPEHLQRLFEAFRSVFFPQISEFFAKGDNEGIKGLVSHAMRVSGVIAVSGAFIAGLFHKEIITLLFSSYYADASIIFFYLMLVLYFYVLGYILWLVLLGCGFSVWSMLVHFFQVIAGVASGILLVPRYRLTGVVMALFIFYLVPIIIPVKLLEIKKIYIDRMTLVKPIAPFVVSYGAFLLLGARNPLIKLIYIMPFVALIFMFSLVSKEDFVIVARVIRSRFASLQWKGVDDI